MAAFVRTSFVDNFRNLVASKTLLNEAIAGGSTDAGKSLAVLMQQPAYIIEGTTDSNTAAASSPVLSLNGTAATDGRCPFPANTERDIIVKTTAVNGANRYRYACAYRVLGSATAPSLVGGESYLTDCTAWLSFTTADGTATTEVAAECIPPAWWDGAAPLAADAASNAIVISWLGGNSPVRLLLPGGVSHMDAAAIAADARSLQHGVTSLANGTSTVHVSDVATPTAANFTNASAVRVNARLFPPVHSPLFVNTTPAPDEITLGALGLSSDLVTWRFEVFVSDLILSPLL